MAVKTPFHEACDQFLTAFDGSRKIVSNLSDVFSAIAWRDFTNDWAPDYAERMFKFNRAQKKFSRDLREWSNSITEEDWNWFVSTFGLAQGSSTPYQGGDRDGSRTKKTKVKSGRKLGYDPGDMATPSKKLNRQGRRRR